MIIQIEIVPLGLEIVNQIKTIANLETTNAIGITLLLKEETLTRAIQTIVRSEATAVRLGAATAVRSEAATAALSAQVVLIQRHNPMQHQIVSLILVVRSEDIDKRKHICA